MKTKTKVKIALAMWVLALDAGADYFKRKKHEEAKRAEIERKSKETIDRRNHAMAKITADTVMRMRCIGKNDEYTHERWCEEWMAVYQKFLARCEE